MNFSNNFQKYHIERILAVGRKPHLFRGGGNNPCYVKGQKEETKGKNGVEEPIVKLRKNKKPVIESEIINISDLPSELQQKLKLSEKQ